MGQNNINSENGDNRMIGIYARVSTALQYEEGYSIDEQLVRLKMYCAAQGRKDIKAYIDPGFTGANTDRPGLQKLIKDVKAGKIKKVVVYKLDRLSRSQADMLDLIDNVFLANNCEFESMTERFDTSTSFGKAMLGILAVFAQLEREQIKERMGLGKAGRAKEGKYHGGGHSPLGYVYTDGELIIDEAEAHVVREMFRLYDEGQTFSGVAKSLTRKGYTGRNGRTIDMKMVRLALENNVYIGKIKHNGEVYDGLHAPLIDETLFNRVNRKIREEDEAKKPVARNKSMLGGLIYCKKCGARYCYYNVGARDGYEYYCCYSRRKIAPAMIKDPNCKNKTYRVEVLDNFILDQIKKIELDEKAFDAAVNDLKAEDNQDQSGIEAEEIARARSEIKKIDEQCSRFLDLYGLGKFTIEQLSEKTDALMDRRAKLEAIISDTEDKIGQQAKAEAPTMDWDEFRETVKSYGDIIDRTDPIYYQEMVRDLIEKIEIDDEDIYIHWRL